jgi:hypothetical protein
VVDWCGALRRNALLPALATLSGCASAHRRESFDVALTHARPSAAALPPPLDLRSITSAATLPEVVIPYNTLAPRLR